MGVSGEQRCGGTAKPELRGKRSEEKESSQPAKWELLLRACWRVNKERNEGNGVIRGGQDEKMKNRQGGEIEIGQEGTETLKRNESEHGLTFGK